MYTLYSKFFQDFFLIGILPLFLFNNIWKGESTSSKYQMYLDTHVYENWYVIW